MILQAYDFVELAQALRLRAADGRLGPVGQHRQRHRSRPPHGHAAALRADHAADHDSPPAPRWARPPPAPSGSTPTCFSPTITGSSGATPRTPTSAASSSSSRACRWTRSRRWSARRRGDQRGQEGPGDRSDRHSSWPRGRRGGRRDGAQDLRAGGAGRDPADGRGAAGVLEAGLGVLTAFGPDYARLVPSTSEARRQVKSGGLRVNDAAGHGRARRARARPTSRRRA